MSSQGMTQAQMEARRRELERQREEQRREQVKQQAMKAAEEIERELLNLAKDGQAAWVHEEVAAITAVVRFVKSAPADSKIDAVFEEIQLERAKLMQLDFTAEQRKDEKQREKWVAEASALGLKLELEARLEDLTYQANKETMKRLIRISNDLVNKAMNGEMQSISDEIKLIRKEALEAHEADEKQAVDEELRREILTALIKTMRELGFAVGKPTLSKETGTVALIGTMSSGRSIRFDVDLSGQMAFDMNGFLERKCADHLDEVLGFLEANYNIQSGPVQHNWKNPDKISKGSKGFPTGGTTRTMGGGQG
jgi:hypothetical protein